MAADGFIDAAFEHGAGLRHSSSLTRSDYAQRLVRGGFPEAVARAVPRRRERFFDSYVSDLVSRDVSQLSEIERISDMRALIRVLASRSAQLLVPTALGNDIRLPRRTTERYIGLLEEVFLIKRIPAWSRNVSTRATATAKVAMVDSGIAANLIGVDADQLLRPDSAFGALLEGFVLMELARQLSWSRQRAELFHYRTRDQVEVDAVIESRSGKVVAVEVKAASTVRSDDFRGLSHLAERLGDDLVVGIVLHRPADLALRPPTACHAHQRALADGNPATSVRYPAVEALTAPERLHCGLGPLRSDQRPDAQSFQYRLLDGARCQAVADGVHLERAVRAVAGARFAVLQFAQQPVDR